MRLPDAFDPVERAGTVLYVAKNDEYLGAIVVADLPKENAADVIASLRAEGARTVMLTETERVRRAASRRRSA